MEKPDIPPNRLRILGEDLVAFREAKGKVDVSAQFPVAEQRRIFDGNAAMICPASVML